MNKFKSQIIFASVAMLSAGAIWTGVQSVAPGASQDIFVGTAHAAEKATIIPAPKVDASEKGKRAVAIFAGGCFWGVEGVFSHTKGVLSVASGYHGGSKETATYKQTNYGNTGHAEAVRVVYDPSQISYGKLMQIYFSVITDPTTLNRQGPDRGSQYRSALVPVNKGQARAARAYIAQLEKGNYWKRPIVTKIETPKTFYKAEAYHQDFMQKNPRHGYIQQWDKPKVENLKKHFSSLYRAKPVS